MTVQIYNRAYNYVQKILIIVQEIEKFPKFNSAKYIDGRYSFHNTWLAARTHKFQQYKTILSLNDIVGHQNHLISNEIYYRITNNSSENTIRAYKDVREFSEELDFQLSTVLNDVELYHFYVQSMLYFHGIRGSVRKNVHHNSLNKYIQLAKSINYEYKQRAALQNDQFNPTH